MADSEASLDEQLELKKRARRRLVGATALVLLAAIVLPMVMDHEPRPTNQDIQVRIPSPEAGSAARGLSAKPVASPLPPAEPAVDTKPVPKAEAPVVAAAPSVQATAPTAKSATPAVAPEKTSEKPAEKTPEKPAAKPVDKSAVEKKVDAEKKADAARAAEALAGGDSAQWVIQLGAYKEAGNVKLLLSKLKGMGVPAYSEKFDSPQGPRTRVRAGPFPDKEAAEKARAKVKIVGVDGPIAPK
ncbi:MAG: SPOR domain-containing protein [Rhodocyclales bacterium]|nr:SPOR domain-containing protein [Rhodocyclales bacterium]